MTASTRTTRRLTTAAAGLALLAGAAYAPAASSAPPVEHPGVAGDGRLATDAVVPRPSADERARLDAAATAAPTPQVAGDPADSIDVAFVYPAALVAQADIGGLEGLRSKFAAAVTETNTAFANSGISVRLRYVGDAQTATPTSTDIRAMLKGLSTAGDGAFDEAQALRETTHADLVSLWASGSVPLGNSCGIGNLGGTNAKYDPETAAFTMLFYTDCVDRYLVFPHEIGHNLSADHDPAAASAPIGIGKPYARGLTDPAHKFITVMAYWEGCTNVGVRDCAKLPYFSGPGVVTAQGHPTGSAAADNVRAINEQAPIVANYRQSQIYGAAPVIKGRANLGRTLSAEAAGWLPASVSISYQWLADGAPIAGATSARLKVTKRLLGRTLSVVATGTGTAYQPVSVASAPSAPVGKRLFARAAKPRIAGRARVGARLRAVVRSWKPAKGVRYRFRWLRDGAPIKGAKGRTYRVRKGDRLHSIRVVVTGKKRGYEATSRRSKAVKVRR